MRKVLPILAAVVCLVIFAETGSVIPFVAAIAALIVFAVLNPATTIDLLSGLETSKPKKRKSALPKHSLFSTITVWEIGRAHV